MTALTAPRLHLPAGVKIVQNPAQYMTTITPGDTLTESVTIHIRGKQVQVITYDRDAAQVIVYIGNRPVAMPAECVGEYLRNNL
jgi:hypothetical protein